MVDVLRLAPFCYAFLAAVDRGVLLAHRGFAEGTYEFHEDHLTRKAVFDTQLFTECAVRRDEGSRCQPAGKSMNRL